jgi:Rad3-related DNA helicase
MQYNAGLMGVFETILGEVKTQVNYEILQTYESKFSFTYLRDPYTFTISKWSRRGFAYFVSLFFERIRDETLFGKMDQDGNYQGSPQQKYHVILQACMDIMTCLNKILIVHKKEVLDYAVWYRENTKESDTYSKYITLCTCHSIVHSEFMTGDVTYELVEF